MEALQLSALATVLLRNTRKFSVVSHRLSLLSSSLKTPYVPQTKQLFHFGSCSHEDGRHNTPRHSHVHDGGAGGGVVCRFHRFILNGKRQGAVFKATVGASLPATRRGVGDRQRTLTFKTTGENKPSLRRGAAVETDKSSGRLKRKTEQSLFGDRSVPC